MQQLEGSVVLVTGSSRGIGKGIAKELAKEGARVAVIARTTEEGSRLPGTIHDTVAEIWESGGQAIPLRCDVTKEDEVIATVEAIIKEFGQIDALVNNAGVLLRGPLVELAGRHLDLILRVNLLGPFLMCKHVIPAMARNGKGSIINITSGAAISRTGGGVPYGVTKAGLNQFSITLADEVKEQNIAVNSLDPGLILTEGARLTQAQGTDFSRFDDPSAMGPACIFLARQDGSGFTGQVVTRGGFGVSWP